MRMLLRCFLLQLLVMLPLSGDADDVRWEDDADYLESL